MLIEIHNAKEVVLSVTVNVTEMSEEQLKSVINSIISKHNINKFTAVTVNNKLVFDNSLTSINQSRRSFASLAAEFFNNELCIDVSVALADHILSNSMQHEWQMYNYEHEDGFDTCIRDDICDKLAEYLVGQPWPRFGDRTDIVQFHKLLSNALKTN